MDFHLNTPIIKLTKNQLIHAMASTSNVTAHRVQKSHLKIQQITVTSCQPPQEQPVAEVSTYRTPKITKGNLILKNHSVNFMMKISLYIEAK